MYIKLIYSTGKDKDKLSKIRAVNYNDEEVSLDLHSYIGLTLTESLKYNVSNNLKGYFITNWVSE